MPPGSRVPPAGVDRKRGRPPGGSSGAARARQLRARARPLRRLVDRMLEHGDTVHILATSREPLGVAGEHVWPLGPLHAEGPALFVERARAAEPRWRWDRADPAVIELCHRLDDVPLALELAAGQLRRFDLDELLRRLDDRLALLWGSPTGDAQRHATMETAIDWSYQLLEPVEQCLLRHLSVFPSSFDVRAVESSAPPLPEQRAVHGVRSARRQEPRRAAARYGALPAPRDDPRLREGPSGGVRRGDCGVRAAPPPRARSDRVVVAPGPVDVGASRRGAPDRPGGRAAGVPAQRAARGDADDAVEIADRDVVPLAQRDRLRGGRRLDRRAPGSATRSPRPGVGAHPACRRGAGPR